MDSTPVIQLDESLIQLDKELVPSKIAEARSKDNKIIEIAPRSKHPRYTVHTCLKEIKSRERIIITLPRCFTHNEGQENIDWKRLHDFQIEFNCNGLSYNDTVPKDVFINIRISREKDAGNSPVIVDIYRL